MKSELTGQSEETRYVFHSRTDLLEGWTLSAHFTLPLWCKWLHYSRGNMSCKDKCEGMLQRFCGALFLPLHLQLLSYISRGGEAWPVLPSCLAPLGMSWAGQGDRKQGLYRGKHFLHSAYSKDAYTFKASSHPTQGKLASMRNGGEGTLQSRSLRTQWERLQLLHRAQQRCTIPGKLTGLWSTRKGRRRGMEGRLGSLSWVLRLLTQS